MSTDQPTSESWDGLLGNYLKAEDLAESEGKIPCTAVEVGEDDEGKPFMMLKVEVNGRKKAWDLNATNRAKLKELGLAKPRDVIGKLLFYKKVTVMNPSTKKEVESLRITKLE